MRKIVYLSAVAVCAAAVAANPASADVSTTQPFGLFNVKPGVRLPPLWPQLPLQTLPAPRLRLPDELQIPVQGVPRDWIPRQFNGMRFYIVQISR
jgi:hypothetical protein